MAASKGKLKEFENRRTVPKNPKMGTLSLEKMSFWKLKHWKNRGAIW